MNQIFGVGRYQKQTKPNKNYGSKIGGYPQTGTSKIQTF